jgi:3-methyladenine DNA glycosylase/8-oxoguanine DNA glycosylase
VADRALSRPDRAAAERMIARMLRLDDTQVGAFHKIDPRWKRSGRGRLFRSPTFFEDLIKTVTSCNVAWPSTIRMNERLCAVFNPAFPRATQIARKRPATLRARCGVGYRDARIVELAKMVASGAIDAEWFEDPATSDDAVHEALLDLPGIGPYAAANIMQLLGRYARLPVDTETVRHAKTVLGMTGSARQIERAVHAHYEPFGAHKFRSYWFEVWAWYEEKRGKAWTWDRETTGKTFTAAQF